MGNLLSVSKRSTVSPQTSVISVQAPKAVSVVPAPEPRNPTLSAASTGRKSSAERRMSSGKLQSLTTNVLFGAYSPSKWDIWMLGITIVIGGQYFSWNAGFEAGLYSYMIAYFVIAGAYITLCCCTSEVSGALPFAGGAYGLSRCTLGFFPGYLIGCCEALEYIAYVATSVVSLAQMIVTTVPIFEGMEPVIALVFYISALFLHIRGNKSFWVFTMLVGSVSVAIVLVFIVGSIKYVDFSANAVQEDLQFVNGFAGFMKSLPLASWFFVGVEALSLASDRVPSPKSDIPFAQMRCVVALFVSGTAILFVSVSLPPGISGLPSELVPFNNCFCRLFAISRRFATVLSLPATYATAFGFMWCYGKLIASMASSRLLPPVLAKTSSLYGTTYASLCFGSLISYFVFLLVHFSSHADNYIFSICITSAFMSYTGQCIGYILLKRNYKNIKSSSFKNPFGVAGALYSMVVWCLGIVAIAGFQGNGGVEILSFGVGALLLTLYYYAYARKMQTFSDQENRVLLVAHVMKFNVRRHKRPSVQKVHVHRNNTSVGQTS